MSGSGSQSCYRLSPKARPQTILSMSLNLSYCRTEFAGQLLNCQISYVKFSRGVLKTNLDGAFVDCDFDSANLTEGLFRGSFICCSFRAANLKHSTGKSVVFENCDFKSANLLGSHLCSCQFKQCDWNEAKFGNGSFYRSKFFGSTPDNLDNTIMDLAEFTNGP